jgi:hypothetical protein
MGVEARHETHAELADDTRRFATNLVVREALFGRETGHPDVIAGTTVA